MERGAGITKNVVREILNHRLCSLHPHIIQVRGQHLVTHTLLRLLLRSRATHGDASQLVPAFHQRLGFQVSHVPVTS